MKNVATAKPPVGLLTIGLLIIMCITLISFTTGCATAPVTGESQTEVQPPKVIKLAGDPNKHKSIFVFLDGTKNDPTSGTNVWRLYELIRNDNKPQTTGIYIEGVGSIDHPLSGAALGRGMQDQLLKGYSFIAQNYNLGDDIYIFGFSRGAHEARALAGLLAYAGVPPIMSGDDGDHLMKIADKIIELTKDKSDEDYLDKWKSWKPGQSPLLTDELKNKIKRDMRPAEVKFLGVWDTVPGSSFKNFGVCKEKKGVFSRWGLAPSEGDRYKSGSYPAIRNIAHAVSIDEKRSTFHPLLLCPAINPQYTAISEKWFPGAHSDVGGGYKDANGQPYIELPGVSLNWMLGLLGDKYMFTSPGPKVPENSKGLAHWSICDAPGNAESECEDRICKDEDLECKNRVCKDEYLECKDRKLSKESFHPSYYARIGSSPVPVLVQGEKKKEPLGLPYPVRCPGPNSCKGNPWYWPF